MKYHNWLVLPVLALSLAAAPALAQTSKDSTTPSRSGPASTDAKAQPKSDAKPQEFSIDGFYVETCSCKPPCPCELTGAVMGCTGVGAYNFEKGKFGGEDFSGTKVAYSLHLGESLHLFIDAPNAAKRAAAEKFARAALKDFGPVKGVHEAKIDMSGKDGAYTVKVDGGKTMAFTTEPVLGGDHKTAVRHENVQDALNQTMYQGQCVSCTCDDGENKISLEKGRNAYFNQHMKSSGKL